MRGIRRAFSTHLAPLGAEAIRAEALAEKLNYRFVGHDRTNVGPALTDKCRAPEETPNL